MKSKFQNFNLKIQNIIKQKSKIKYFKYIIKISPSSLSLDSFTNKQSCRIENQRMETYTSRILTLNDMKGIIEVDESAWGQTWLLSQQFFTNLLTKHPYGCYGLFEKDFMISTVFFKRKLTAQKQLYQSNLSWQEIVDDKQSQNQLEKANCIYLLSVSVRKQYQNIGVSKLLQKTVEDYVQNHNLDFIYGGSRIPKFKSYILQKYNNQIPDQKTLDQEANKYIRMKNSNGKIYDPELRFYVQYNKAQICRVISNFGPDDQSLNYGVMCIRKVKKNNGGINRNRKSNLPSL